MTTLERIGKLLDAVFCGGGCNSWPRDLVIALLRRLMLASVIRERSEQQKTSGSFHARRFDTCMLWIIENRGSEESEPLVTTRVGFDLKADIGCTRKNVSYGSQNEPAYAGTRCARGGVRGNGGGAVEIG